LGGRGKEKDESFLKTFLLREMRNGVYCEEGGEEEFLGRRRTNTHIATRGNNNKVLGGEEEEKGDGRIGGSLSAKMMRKRE